MLPTALLGGTEYFKNKDVANRVAKSKQLSHTHGRNTNGEPKKGSCAQDFLLSFWKIAGLLAHTSLRAWSAEDSTSEI